MGRIAANMRQAIIDAAAKLFDERGYEKVSMRNIAREVGCSATALYNYFENKDAVLVELIKQAYARFNRAIRQGLLDGGGDPRETFRRACFAYIDFGLKYPKYYNLMFRDNAEQFVNLTWKEESDERFDTFDLLRRAVEDGIRKGMIRGRRADVVSQSIWASLHGLTSLLLVFPDFEWGSRESLIDYHIDALMAGVFVSP